MFCKRVADTKALAWLPFVFILVTATDREIYTAAVLRCYEEAADACNLAWVQAIL